MYENEIFISFLPLVGTNKKPPQRHISISLLLGAFLSYTPERIWKCINYLIELPDMYDMLFTLVTVLFPECFILWWTFISICLKHGFKYFLSITNQCLTFNFYIWNVKENFLWFKITFNKILICRADLKGNQFRYEKSWALPLFRLNTTKTFFFHRLYFWETKLAYRKINDTRLSDIFKGVMQFIWNFDVYCAITHWWSYFFLNSC